MNRQIDDNTRSVYKATLRSRSLLINIPLGFAKALRLRAGDKVLYEKLGREFLVISKIKSEKKQ